MEQQEHFFVTPDTTNVIINANNQQVYQIKEHDSPAVWSIHTPMPASGDEVTVNFNGFGKGCVVGYFTAPGSDNTYIGLMVVPYHPPAWYVQQQSRAFASMTKPWRKANIICVFGAELL